MKKHNYLIDMLRFFAAFVVTIGHLNSDMPNVHSWYHTFTAYFWLGVPVFFVISGYCIILSASKSANAKDFFIRRFFRIYPAYWVSLIIVLIAVCFQRIYLGANNVLNVPKNISSMLATITITTSPLTNIGTTNWVYWTLTCELLFYLVVCLMLIVNKKYLLYLVTSISLLALVVPFQTNGPLFFLNHWPAFGLGAGIFFYFNKPDNLSRSFTIVLLVSSIAAMANKFVTQPEYTITAVITFIVIVISNYFVVKNNLLSRLGQYSYSVYLIHVPIGVFIIRTFESQYIIDRPYVTIIYNLIVYVVISVFAWLMFEYIEKPSIDFGKNISKKYLNRNIKTQMLN